MDQKSTIFNYFYKKSSLVKGLLFVFVLSAIIFSGCYEWRTINQPEAAAINSYFDVYLSAQDDGNPDNDWTNEDLHDIGLFGVLLPNGWTVGDSIPFTIVCTDPAYDNQGILIYDLARTATLQDSIPAPPGYHWWGANTDGEASMIFFDSLYFSPRIFTGSATGDFFLRYAIGDVDYWDRNPADDISDPIPITLYDPVGVKEMLSDANVSIYPNPSSGQLNIKFNNYKQEVVEMEIFDVSGKLIRNSILTESLNNFDIESLQSGVYIIKLSNSGISATHKFLINN